MISYISNGKFMIIHVIVGLIKKILLYKKCYFSDPYTHNKSKIEVELDFSNYETKSGSRNTTGIDTMQFAKKEWSSKRKIISW